MFIKLQMVLIAMYWITGCSEFSQQEQVVENIQHEPDTVEDIWFPVKTSSPPNTSYADNNFEIIDGKPYYKNLDGNLVLDNSEIESLKSKGIRVFNPKPITGIELDSEVLGALMQDQDALFTFLKNPSYSSPGEVSFVLKEGSLKDNMLRLSKSRNINHFRWELPFNFHISKSKIITAPNFNELLGTVSRGFPIEATIENDGTNNTVLRVYEIGQHESRISFVINEGSLKENFLRLSNEAGWDNEWAFNHDFHVPSTQILRGSNYKDILSKLLTIQQYPIVAETTN